MALTISKDMVQKVIIFDFDGTLATTQAAFLKILNSLAAEFGYRPVSEAEIAQLRNLSSREVIQKSEISLLKIPFLLRRAKAELGKEIATIAPVEGMTGVLQELSSRGHYLGIITSNNKYNVLAFLENNHWRDFFAFIYSGTSLFGKHKIINRALRENKLSSEEIFYVGDETRDIQAAQKSKVKMIAVSWGFNSEEVLAAYQPDYLLSTAEDIVQVVDSTPKEKLVSGV